MNNLNQETIVQQQPSMSEIPHSKNKLTPILLMTFLLVVVGVGAYLLGANKPQPIVKTLITPTVSPTPDPTANWQTYVNATYGYEVKYPDNWLLNHNLPGGYPATTLEYNNSVTKEVATIDIGRNQTTAIGNGDIKLAEKEINQTISNAKTILKSKNAVKIANYDGYEVIGTFCTSICTGSSQDIYTPFSYIYFSDGKKVVQISYSEGLNGVGSKTNINDWKYYSIFKQILSTFKFTP